MKTSKSLCNHKDFNENIKNLYENKEISNINNDSINHSSLTINHYKDSDEFQAISYTVSARALYNDSGYVDLSMFIRNEGQIFALANCTFSVLFDDEVLEFMKLIGADSVMFNSGFDYTDFNDDNTVIPDEDGFGYMRLSSAPNNNSANSYKNIRSIEVDYDAFNNIGGINVPNTNTYLGTLRFKVRNEAGVISFRWHESKAVLTTDGRNITDDGKWDSIPAILLYSLKLTQPNGGEQYSVLRKETVRWTVGGNSSSSVIASKAWQSNNNKIDCHAEAARNDGKTEDQFQSSSPEIYIEFSSNNGAIWNRLNIEDTVYANALSYSWTTPNISSNNCLIRILDATTGIELDRSDNVFSINRPWGRIDYPNVSSGVFKGDSKIQIEFAAGGTNCVKFEFSSDGVNWSSIVGTFNPNNVQRANWTVPKITTRTAYIHMLDCESNLELDRSGPFTILNGEIRFTRPTNNQAWISGRTERVVWTRRDVDEFDLDLSIDGGLTWERIEDNVDAFKLRYDWLVINECTENAMFRALYQGDPNMEYGRSNRFRILCTSIFEDEENIKVGNVYPNPVKDIASIDFNFAEALTLSIKLIDISGSTVREYAVNEVFIGVHRFELDLSGIASGSYYLLISSGDDSVLREVSVGR